ncbi:questin oxidase family protein [Streptomyces sp. NBC_00572]|uniref:questin oxidase family protein n=1 Tax=Streptomyces sp. NBC_00572 TaxID=2903664 RepID=UPI00225231E9|nr:questin oxidase family protein [Streptomyces sp. NBC_00572]MCX4981467.1 questin oxidase family protein [Streptomyces sp. NBC_00572]
MSDARGTKESGTLASGTLDEALERLHTTGPERNGWLTNHAPMAVEALVRNGQASTVHRWLDRYAHKLEELPPPSRPVTADGWREALGDPARITDWTRFFARELDGRPWREVLAEWWPRLLPGIAASATHPVIRTGHAVRTLLASGDEEVTAPRRAELAHALGYWAARSLPLPPLTPLAAAPTAAAALDAVPPVPVQDGGIRDRLAQLTAFPVWGTAPDPDTARDRLVELVTAATHRYATHGHGEPIMLVHAATAPNAVLRALPALPRELWAPSLAAAWSASAAVTAAYTPPEPAAYTPTALTAEEVFERAAAHGDDHTIKFTDTALDVGGPLALAAATRSIELNPPVF